MQYIHIHKRVYVGILRKRRKIFAERGGVYVCNMALYIAYLSPVLRRGYALVKIIVGVGRLYGKGVLYAGHAEVMDALRAGGVCVVFHQITGVRHSELHGYVHPVAVRAHVLAYQVNAAVSAVYIHVRPLRGGGVFHCVKDLSCQAERNAVPGKRGVPEVYARKYHPVP